MVGGQREKEENVLLKYFLCPEHSIEWKFLFRLVHVQLYFFFRCAVYLEPSVHEPGHLKDVDQVQDIRVVALHTLTQKCWYLIILCLLSFNWYNWKILNLCVPIDDVYVHIFQSSTFTVKHPRNLGIYHSTFERGKVFADTLWWSPRFHCIMWMRGDMINFFLADVMKWRSLETYHPSPSFTLVSFKPVHKDLIRNVLPKHHNISLFSLKIYLFPVLKVIASSIIL